MRPMLVSLIMIIVNKNVLEMSMCTIHLNTYQLYVAFYVYWRLCESASSIQSCRIDIGN